jgi:cysteine synthase
MHYTFAHPGMPHQSQYYVLGAFLLGVVLTAAYNKRSSLGEEATDNVNLKRQLHQQQKLISRFAKINDLDTLKKSLVEITSSLEKGAGNIREGIEGCIGDTPLIKIKSLSDYTGCEILAKAEVIYEDHYRHSFPLICLM